MKRIVLILLVISCISLNTRAVEPNTPKVVIVVDWGTSWGYIGLELFHEQAPITVANFLEYVDSGFYYDVVFHQSLDDPNIIQTGRYEPIDVEPWLGVKTDGLRDPIINESYNGLLNERGAVAMARELEDPNSATSGYLFNVTQNSGLDGDFCVFGRVISGMDGVDWVHSLYTSWEFGFFDLPSDVPLYYDGSEFHIIYADVYRAPLGWWLKPDLNNSGIVNLRDFALLANNWKKEGEWLAGDLNDPVPDGIVDYNDLGVFSSQFLDTTDWYWD